MTDETLARLRDQVAGLLSQIDTAAKPRPTVITRAPERNAGAAWHPVKDWTVRTINDELLEPCFVYVTYPEHVRTEVSGDFDALTTDDARRLAMALLAAADWADGLAADVTPLDGQRPDYPSKEIS
ncbi:hypothetical protein [Actinomadura decatromicini]|uniref:Uncharacterized protein n=1 Tax=Actinomadura decatromicini TaxID=2604572 RepID=A0A5D3FBH9_9ACTN|nr:hypothetical protein [Actinomadura decatromicini]TYK45196.1 hypothetical protein FXF68_31455 [Actinomadura decatromicini]